MPIYIPGPDYKAFVYEKNEKVTLRRSLERHLAQAREDAKRMRVEIRVTPNGSPASHQKHQWEVDPDVCADDLLKHIWEKLGESPGKGFTGQIRINFSPAGNTGDRYGSFSRVVMPAPIGYPQDNGRTSDGIDEVDEVDQVDEVHEPSRVQCWGRDARWYRMMAQQLTRIADHLDTAEELFDKAAIRETPFGRLMG